MAQNLTMDEFNAKLDWVKKSHTRIAKAGEGRGKYKYRKTCDVGEAFIDEKPTNVKLVVKEPGNARANTYVFYLDGEEHFDELVVPQAVREFYQYYKPPYISTRVGSASPILGNNPKYDRTRNYAYEYDLNSAYSFALLGDMPDTTKNLGPKVVEEDELGYNSWTRVADSQTILEKAEIGEEARFVFKRMPSPYQGYVKKYYEKKKNSVGNEKKKAKAYLNVVIGNLQNQNPFLRAEVVCSANKIIKDLIDENTLYWNTDSIVSLVRRPDIEKNLGIEIGQWKLDKEGEFAFAGFNYQWDDEVPGIRGVPKAWFHGQKYDLLRDGIPMRNNPYIFDWETGEVRKNEGFEMECFESSERKSQ